MGEPRHWLDSVDLSAPDWWDKLDLPGEKKLQQPAQAPLLPPTQLPHRSISNRARAVKDSLPWPSRGPGGRHRGHRRSVGRMVPAPTVPVDPALVLEALQRRWRGKHGETLPWRCRGLAVLAVALAVPAGTTTEALVRMMPSEVLELRMPRAAWKWVLRWLRIRRQVLGPGSEYGPWTAFHGSRGMPRMIGWAATRTLDRAHLPGWRFGQLLRSEWPILTRPTTLDGYVERRRRRPAWLTNLIAVRDAAASQWRWPPRVTGVK
jgi:hypothetical protein